VSEVLHAVARLTVKGALGVSVLILALLFIGAVAGAVGITRSPLPLLLVLAVGWLVRREMRLARRRGR